ncbi:MAG: hypothetical protein RIS94_1828 [Pseudomonadota bacterium]|jgi:hypothetical protein
MITAIVLAAGLATLSPASTPDHALRCAATNAMIATMLESGEPTAEDRDDAARFRRHEAVWLNRAGADAPARLTGEVRTLAEQVGASPSAQAAQQLLETRLGECAVPAALDGHPAAASDVAPNAT